MHTPEVLNDPLYCAANRSGVLGTVVLFSAGDAEAGVVFDGENVETCERVLVQDLEAADVGFRADPDTPAQPVVAQVLSLLRALLHSDEVSQALSLADSERLAGDVRAMVWLRVLSQSLMAVLQLSVHCSDTLVAACQEADVVTHVLPELLEVAMCPIQIPALITAQVGIILILLRVDLPRNAWGRATWGWIVPHIILVGALCFFANCLKSLAVVSECFFHQEHRAVWHGWHVVRPWRSCLLMCASKIPHTPSRVPMKSCFPAWCLKHRISNFDGGQGKLGYFLPSAWEMAVFAHCGPSNGIRYPPLTRPPRPRNPMRNLWHQKRASPILPRVVEMPCLPRNRGKRRFLYCILDDIPSTAILSWKRHDRHEWADGVD